MVKNGLGVRTVVGMMVEAKMVALKMMFVGIVVMQMLPTRRPFVYVHFESATRHQDP
jgi:hypothetical protein